MLVWRVWLVWLVPETHRDATPVTTTGVEPGVASGGGVTLRAAGQRPLLPVVEKTWTTAGRGTATRSPFSGPSGTKSGK